MKIREIASLLDATALGGEDLLDTEVRDVFCCDMMSDVLAFATNQAVLITGLVNLQVIRTAMMLDMRCIVFVCGKKPSDDIISLAEANDMVLLTTDHYMYTTAGRLYATGMLHGD